MNSAPGNPLEKRVKLGDTGRRANSAVGQVNACQLRFTCSVRGVVHQIPSEFLMPRTLVLSVRDWTTAITLSLVLISAVKAETVWSGLTFTFANTGGAADLPQNQDRITDNVWLSRNSFGQGLLNAATECEPDSGCTYAHNSSPRGTRWANGGMIENAGKTIAATNWQELTFTDWEDSYGNHVGGFILLPNYRDVVVHLIGDAIDPIDDIYLDLRFTGWTQRAGGFSYQRAEAPITPPMATGDYNENGFVDAADYVLWRDTLSQMANPAGSGADGNMNGTVDAADYDFWRARFGTIAPIPGVGASAVPAIAAAVPEPSFAALLISGLLALPWRRYKRAVQVLGKRGGVR